MRRQGIRILASLAAIAALTLGAVPTAAGRASARPAAAAAGCADPNRYPAQRDPSNPLDLPNPPGANPLSGANFFVDGPAHGAAAGAIASLLGLDPKRLPNDLSWAQFQQQHAGQIAANPQARALAKIADQPEANRFSLYSMGGGPGAIYGQVHKIVCDNMAADPGTVPIFTTFFLYQAGYCETRSEILAHRHTFERQINEMARGIGRRPAVMLLELDAVGASRCEQRNGALPYWEGDMRYEINKVAALPHTVVYMEAGYADSNDPRYTARVLNAVGIRKIRGFWTNDTHEDWTINEVRWGERVSRLTHGAHFIVNTATNGQGPLVPADRVHQGNEVLCNPPGRGIGPLPQVDPGYRGVDAFLWTAPPGNSSGACRGGPPAGTFWAAKAVAMSALANGRLGPAFPSRPY
ncbi:MAG TPA: glycoside hydrolase family 6 protein [Solirubrobacteraceae bacterium]|nr:glycoside hydrolase family 6 protein [Solirubrobacteraceae bacterium]